MVSQSRQSVLVRMIFISYVYGQQSADLQQIYRAGIHPCCRVPPQITADHCGVLVAGLPMICLLLEDPYKKIGLSKVEKLFQHHSYVYDTKMICIAIQNTIRLTGPMR